MSSSFGISLGSYWLSASSAFSYICYGYLGLKGMRLLMNSSFYILERNASYLGQLGLILKTIGNFSFIAAQN